MYVYMYYSLCYVFFVTGSYKVKYGKLSSVPRNPMPPPERIYCSTLSQWPRLPVSTIHA